MCSRLAQSTDASYSAQSVTRWPPRNVVVPRSEAFGLPYAIDLPEHHALRDGVAEDSAHSAGDEVSHVSHREGFVASPYLGDP